MNKKWDLWLWLGLASIFIGGVLAIFLPLLHGFWHSEDYEWGSVLLRFSVFTPVCFGVLVLLLFFIRLTRIVFPFARIAFRWLFTWRTLKWSLRSLAALLVLLFLFFYVEENWRIKRQWENYQREWEVKGEHFDFASFVPPPVPDDQNFALTPIVATSYEWMLDKNGHELKPHRTNYVERIRMEKYAPNDIGNDYLYYNQDLHLEGNWAQGRLMNLKGWQQYYRAMAEKTNLFAVPPQPQSPAADVLLALSKYDSTIEELRNASHLMNSRFPLNYDAKLPQQVYLMHLAYLKNCCETLQLRASAELQNDQSDKALADVELSLRLTDSIRNEPNLISYRIRIGMLIMTLQPIWEGLVEHKWPDAQLTELDKKLAQLDLLADCEFAARGERATALEFIDYIQRTRDVEIFEEGGFHSLDDSSEPLMKVFVKVFVESAKKDVLKWGPSSIFYQNKLTYARIFQQTFLPSFNVEQRTVSPEMTSKFYGAFGISDRKWQPDKIFAYQLSGSLGAVFQRCAQDQSSVDLARIACALERYRLAHGEYPEMLDALAPQFMEKIPHDIIGGQPLHYRHTDGGKFLLYSVGWNEKDDGGVVVLREGFTSVDDQKSDWIWQFPQK